MNLKEALERGKLKEFAKEHETKGNTWPRQWDSMSPAALYC